MAVRFDVSAFTRLHEAIDNLTHFVAVPEKASLNEEQCPLPSQRIAEQCCGSSTFHLGFSKCRNMHRLPVDFDNRPPLRALDNLYGEGVVLGIGLRERNHQKAPHRRLKRVNLAGRFYKLVRFQYSSFAQVQTALVTSLCPRQSAHVIFSRTNSLVCEIAPVTR